MLDCHKVKVYLEFNAEGNSLTSAEKTVYKFGEGGGFVTWHKLGCTPRTNLPRLLSIIKQGVYLFNVQINLNKKE